MLGRRRGAVPSITNIYSLPPTHGGVATGGFRSLVPLDLRKDVLDAHAQPVTARHVTLKCLVLARFVRFWPGPISEVMHGWTGATGLFDLSKGQGVLQAAHSHLPSSQQHSPLALQPRARRSCGLSSFLFTIIEKALCKWAEALHCLQPHLHTRQYTVLSILTYTVPAVFTCHTTSS